MVVALGLTVQAVETACVGGDCPGNWPSCNGGQCGQCPHGPVGSCYAGTEGCAAYGCEPDFYNDTCKSMGVCFNFCYCAPCA